MLDGGGLPDGWDELYKQAPNADAVERLATTLLHDRDDARDRAAKGQELSRNCHDGLKLQPRMFEPLDRNRHCL
jgi:hypothetical protein